MSEKAVIVTGASSGMGRATALRLAARGDSVVVAARREDLLRELARECEQAGGRALAVATDVTDAAAVESLAERAVEEFGRIDAWVHTSAASSFGKFVDTPIEVHRRVVDVVLGGTLTVAHVALRRFMVERRGNLVLVASALGEGPVPYLSAYNAGKAGVLKLAETLREELAMDSLDDVHVCTLLPPSVDTPFYEHAANYEGRVPRPPPPVYDVETAAEALVELVDRPKPETAMGAMGKLMVVSHKLTPGLYDALARPYSATMFLDETTATGPGALFEPTSKGRTAEGGWKETRHERR